NHNDACIFFDRNKLLVVGISEQMNNPLFKTSLRQMKHFVTIMMKGKMYFRMSQSDTLEFIYDMAQFHRIPLQEIASGRCIKEKVFYADAATRTAGYRLLFHDF